MASVVSVEKRILLVPLSKMMLRDRVKIELVLPFTDTLGEVSDQVEPVDANEAKIGVPVNLVLSIPPSVNSAFPTARGVRYMLKRDGKPWFTRLAKNP